jgi:hypothetical protein
MSGVTGSLVAGVVDSVVEGAALLDGTGVVVVVVVVVSAESVVAGTGEVLAAGEESTVSLPMSSAEPTPVPAPSTATIMSAHHGCFIGADRTVGGSVGQCSLGATGRRALRSPQ